jgi:hypothetical protein
LNLGIISERERERKAKAFSFDERIKKCFYHIQTELEFGSTDWQ